MSTEIHCPHCREPLDGSHSLSQTALMCPWCGNLFSLGDNSIGSGQAITGEEGGYIRLPGYDLAMPRPAGVTAVAVIGIIISSLILLSVTCLGTMVPAIDHFPELSEEMQKNMSEGESLPANTTAFWVTLGIILVTALVCLWTSIQLLRRHESARRILWGISLGIAIVTSLSLISIVRQFPATESLRTTFTIAAICIYSIFVCIYLRRHTVRKWFTG